MTHTIKRANLVLTVALLSVLVLGSTGALADGGRTVALPQSISQESGSPEEQKATTFLNMLRSLGVSEAYLQWFIRTLDNKK